MAARLFEKYKSEIKPVLETEFVKNKTLTAKVEKAQPGAPGWTLFVLMIATGLLALIALSRAGIRHFWSTHVGVAPQLRVLEGLPIAALLALCITLTLLAGPVMRFTQATADALHSPGTYIRAVMQAQPIPGPTTPRSAGSPKEAP